MFDLGISNELLSKKLLFLYKNRLSWFNHSIVFIHSFLKKYGHFLCFLIPSMIPHLLHYYQMHLFHCKEEGSKLLKVLSQFCWLLKTISYQDTWNSLYFFHLTMEYFQVYMTILHEFYLNKNKSTMNFFVFEVIS